MVNVDINIEYSRMDAARVDMSKINDGNSYCLVSVQLVEKPDGYWAHIEPKTNRSSSIMAKTMSLT